MRNESSMIPVSSSSEHYEVDYEPFWKPSTEEDVLRRQLDQLKLMEVYTKWQYTVSYSIVYSQS